MIRDYTQIPSFNVGEITFLIKNALEERFPVVRVKGEISNFRPAASGHCYFNLKDRDAVLTSVLFRQQRQSLAFVPADGMSVTVIGRITVYPQRGNYQLICETMEQSGRGDLLYQLEMLKKKLEQEGLFDSERKAPLPLSPRTIAAVTSARGAAVQDIIQVLKRRMKSFKLKIYDTVVQGEQSAPSIVRSLNAAAEDGETEIIILARGGGSMEDLISFSDERVVRAVAASPIPVISGVGHETDFSLSDFAADHRAPTPSAAAEIVSAGTLELTQKLSGMRNELARLLSHSVERAKWQLSSCGRENLTRLFRENIEEYRQFPDLWKMEQTQILKDRIREYRYRSTLTGELISSVSPETMLSRGYSLIYKDNSIINSASSLKESDRVTLRFRDGERTAVIEGKEQ